MKKFSMIVAAIMLLTMLFSLASCNKGIVSDETYYMYTYDTRTDRFIRSRSALRFGDDLTTFEYTFIEGELTVSGVVEHTEVPNAYTIICSDEAVDLVTARYKDILISSGASDDVLSMYGTLAAAFTPRTQYFAYEKNLFAGDSVEMFREAGADSDSFEGVYRINDQEDKLRFRGGNVYAADEDGYYTVKKGYYSAARGILTFTSVNEDGTDRYEKGVLYRKRYLMAKITIPTEEELLGTSLDEQLQNSDFVSKINEDISDYSGKTIAVLVERFFSKDL
ncbi:MAG: hypothetical protein J5765_02035 [Clostridia bacterium]|nr:hypothetical protein [Clostridia bacterium]